jgi:hypothetical protein
MLFMPSIRSLLFALVMLAVSTAAFAQIGISIIVAPPALPVYEPPPLLAQGLSGHLGTGLTVRAITTGCQVRG